MSAASVREVSDLQDQLKTLHAQNEELRQRALDAEQRLAAFVRGEVDAVRLDASATPVLLVAAQEKLRSSHQLLRAIFDGALEPMVLTDAAGRYVGANRAACDLYGVPREQLVGRHRSDLGAAAVADETSGVGFRERGHMRGTFTLERADGTRRALEFSSVSNVAPGLDLSVMVDVTDRVAAQAALERSEARFRTLTEKSSDVILLVDRNGTLLYVSPSVIHLLGWTAEELMGGERESYVFPEDRASVAAAHARLLDEVGEVTMEFRALHRDGSIRWIEASGRNLCADRDVRAIVANLHDVTARVHAEGASRESHRRLEEAQAIAHVGSWTASLLPDGEVEWSREGARIFDAPEGVAMSLTSFFQRVHPEDRARFERMTRDAIEHGSPADVEHRIVRPDGSIRWVHERGVVQRDACGVAVRMVGTVKDITDRHLAVEALRASAAEFRLLAEAMPQMVWITDADGANVYVNQRWIDYTGLTLDESLGAGWTVPFYGDDLPAAERARQQATASGGTYSIECRLRRADGSYAWWLIRGVPVHDAAGTVIKWFSTCTDIDALKRAQARVVESETLLRLTGRAARLGGWSISLAQSEVTWSEEICAILEFPEGTQPTLEQAMRLYPPEVRELIREKIDACARDGSPFDLELPIMTGRQRRIWVRAIGTAQRDAAGAITTLYGAFQDIDERRKLQDQLRQTQKMEAVGRLAGGVAHDFNNLLTVILSYAAFALDSLKPGDPMRDDLAQIRSACQRATQLTRQLLAFSRQQVLQPRVIDLNDVVTDMLSMLGRLLGEDIELTTLPAPRLGCIHADPGQIEQVVVSLAVNAREAMPKGGTISLETRNVQLDAQQVAGHEGCAPGAYVMLAIRDTGPGIDAATRARMFEPFFTTKEVGKGSGLGLATVLGIVQQSGGYLEVDSELGQGATFRIYFPRTEQVASVVSSVNPAPLLRGTETILLVEDEQHVRTVTSAVLRRHGYTVLEAANGGEAFLISKDFGQPIELLLTDVVMPRVSGRRLAEQLVRDRPAMRVLYTSGYTNDTIVLHGVLNAGVELLQKPFTPDSLLRRVRAVLTALPAAQ